MSAFNPMPAELDNATPDQAPPAAPAPAQDPQQSFMDSPDSQAKVGPNSYPPSPDQPGAPGQTVGANPTNAPETIGGKLAKVATDVLHGLGRHALGAAEGLYTGGIPGAIEGAANPARAQQNLQNRNTEMDARAQEAQANAKMAAEKAAYLPTFEGIQAASQMTDTAYKQEQTRMLPQQLRDAQLREGDAQASNLRAAGFFPSTTIPYDENGDIDPRAFAGRQIGNNIAWLHTSAGLQGFDMGDPSAVSQIPMINTANMIMGNPFQYNTGSWANSKTKAKDATNANNLWQPVIHGNDQEMLAQVKAYDSYIANVANGPDTYPDGQTKDGVTKRLEAVRDRIQKAYDAAVAEKERQLRLRGAAINESKPVQVTDENGVPTYVPAGQAEAGHMPTAAAGQHIQKSVVQPAMDVERSYQQFTEAYKDHQAGKDDTGAPSMLALSQHLATTFGNVKGSRVTKDMIAEHLGARSISDDALVAVQKLTTGDRLSDKQWTAFYGLITQAREIKWNQAVQQARQQHINIDGDLPADVLKRSGSTAPAGAQAPPAAAPSQPAQPTAPKKINFVAR